MNLNGIIMEKEIKRKRVYYVIRLVLAFIVVTILGTALFYSSHFYHERGLVWSLIMGASTTAILLAMNFWRRWRRAKKEGRKSTFEDLFDNRNKGMI